MAYISIRISLLLVTFVCLTSFALAQAVRTNGGFRQAALPEGDDTPVASNVPLGFTANFFGRTYTTTFVNNNGNVTFDTSNTSFTPTSIPSLGFPMIAPFWADVDTSNGLGRVFYGRDTVNGRAAFAVTYDAVGYFNRGGDKRNTFQLVLIDRGDTGTGNFDIEFNYNQVQWEAGSATGAATGVCPATGCTPAEAGYTNGSRMAGTSDRIAGSGVRGAFLDSSPTALRLRSVNSGVAGRFIYFARAGQVIVTPPPPVAEPPRLISINPSQALAGSTVNLVATGANFRTGDVLVARRDGRDTQMTTTVQSSTELRAPVPSSLLATPGLMDILVLRCNDGCIGSNALPFTIGTSLRLLTLSPDRLATRPPEAPPVDIFLSGQGFSTGAQVIWQPGAVSLEVISRTSSNLQARVPATLLGAPVTANVLVRNPATANAVEVSSNTLPLTVFVDLRLDGLSPDSVPSGSPDTRISAVGTGFTSGSRLSFRGAGIQFNPAEQVVIGSTRIDATVRAAFLGAAVNYDVSVVEGSFQSNTRTFSVTAGLRLSGINPTSRDAGSGPFPLVLTGTGFAAGAQVNFGGVLLNPASVTATDVRVNVPGELIVNAGVIPVAVRVGGRDSNAANFQVNPGRSCVNFPVGFVPFASVYSVTQSGPAGDRLLVGRLNSPSTLRDIDSLIPLPGAPGQKFCGLVQLAPGQLVEAFVPTAAERRGDFSAFSGLLIDPVSQVAFPGGIIPSGRLGDPYAWRVTIASAAATPGLIVSQRGFTFNAVQGGGAPSARSLRVLSGGDPFSYIATATTTSGGNWLSLSPSSGSTDSASAVQVQTNPGNLTPGDYYGEIRIDAPGAQNSPQTVTVVLNVAPRNVAVAPAVEPTGLVVVSAPGMNASGRSIRLTNLSAVPLVYSTSVNFPSAAWFGQPAGGTVNPNQPVTVNIAPNTTALRAGVFPATLQFSFSDGTNVPVTLVLVVAPGGGSGFAAERQARTADGDCMPTRLIPVSTLLANSFATLTAWPSPLEVVVVDDCANAFNGGGEVLATFSNGDPPLPLIPAGRTGLWSATWVPRNARGVGLNVTLEATQSTPLLRGTSVLNGSAQTNPDAPVVSGVLGAANFTAPPSPGAIVSLFGSRLSNRLLQAPTLPLPIVLDDTRVSLGGMNVPMFFSSDGQINAMLPYQLAVGVPLSLTVRRGNRYSVPEQVVLAPVQPAVFSVDLSGRGQGHVYSARGLAGAGAPVGAGEFITIYCAGLGPVNANISAGDRSPVATLTNPLTVRVNGIPAAVQYAGLAPGFAGLYQVNAVIPSGVAPGEATLTLEVNSVGSAPVTIRIR